MAARASRVETDSAKGKPQRDADVEVIRRELGRRLRALRLDRGLTVRALAGDAGVTPGFISQIENGRVMPSIGTLVRIASILNARVGDLFDGQEPSGRIVHSDERTVLTYPEQGVRDELLSRDGSRRLEVLISYVEPSGGTGGTYTHGAEVEFALVLTGEIELTLGDQTHTLVEGDSITFPGNVSHGYRNRSSAPATLLWALTPGTY